MLVRLTGTIACVAALLAAVPSAAQQTRFSAADLPLVMTAYVEAAIDMRAAYETCAPEDKRPADWEQGSALLIESLRAAGLNAAVASALQTRMAAPVVATTADCAGEQVMLYSGVPAGTSWPDYHRTVLGLHGMKIVEPGAADARLAAVRAVVAEALPKQQRMLVCISLFDPQNFLAAFSDWNELVDKAGESLAAAGFGSDVYRPILDGASAGALFAAPSDRTAAAADCIADQDWYERFSTFAWYTFASDIEAAVKGGKP